RGAQPAGIGTWRTALPAIGQRAGVRQSPDPGMDRGVGNRLGADRSRQALAERHRRELQRPLPGRMSESRVVPQPARSASDHRNLAAALQPGPPALEPGLPYAGRVRRQSPFHQPEGRSLETPGPKLPEQVTGILMDLGFDWRLARVFVFVPRAAGIAAHAVEEVKRERGWRVIAKSEDIDY